MINQTDRACCNCIANPGEWIQEYSQTRIHWKYSWQEPALQ